MSVGIRDAIAYFRDGSVPIVHKAMGLLAILYVFSPVDLVPDVIPLVGWLDDIGVVALIATYYMRQISRYQAPTPNPRALLAEVPDRAG